MDGDKQLENGTKERHGRCRDDRSADDSSNHGNDNTAGTWEMVIGKKCG
jgi:hypothetical protein